MKIGWIYKITSPTGRIYIGQTISIERRRREYSKLCNCKDQIRLFRSLNKYGWLAHDFSIIEECSIIQLNIRERFWQDHYKVLSEKGLNCVLTSTNQLRGILSEQTKQKIGLFNKGKKFSKETRIKMSNSLKGRKLSDETKRKLSELNKGKSNKGYKLTFETRQNMSKAKKGKKASLGSIEATRFRTTNCQFGGNNPIARIVINLDTGYLLRYY